MLAVKLKATPDGGGASAGIDTIIALKLENVGETWFVDTAPDFRRNSSRRRDSGSRRLGDPRRFLKAAAGP
jgi:hypothetical protein